MNRLPLLSLLLLCAWTVGCSGRGAGAGTTTQGALQVVVDTRNDGGTLLEARVTAVTLVRADGSRSLDLLGRDAVLRLSSPDGAPSGMALAAPPPGTYVGIDLVLAGNGLQMRTDDGRLVTVRPQTPVLQVSLDEPLVHDGRSAAWLCLRHTGELGLSKRKDGAWIWNPGLGLRKGLAEGLKRVQVELVSVDLDARRMLVRLVAVDDLPITVVVPDQVVLVRGWSKQSLAGFAAALERGETVVLDGRLMGDRFFVLDLGRRTDQVKTGTEALGAVLEVDTIGQRLRVQLLDLRRGGDELDPRALPALWFDASSATIRRSSDPLTPMSLGDLSDGETVLLHWTTTSGPLPVLDQVELIDAELRCSEAMGVVAAVDLGKQTIRVVPFKQVPLRVAGKTVSEVELRLEPRSYLYRVGPGGKRDETLAGVRGGDRVWFRGRGTGPVVADQVRVKQD